MHLKPIRISWRVVEIVMFPVTCLYFVFFGPVFAIWWLCDRLKKPISAEWHPVFAWWPTRCDDWANDGFVGTVWLDSIERRNKFPHGVEFRRPVARASASPRQVVGASSRDELSTPPQKKTEGE